MTTTDTDAREASHAASHRRKVEEVVRLLVSYGFERTNGVADRAHGQEFNTFTGPSGQSLLVHDRGPRGGVAVYQLVSFGNKAALVSKLNALTAA